MNKTNIITIAKKEFLGFINSTTAYILVVPFILITFFLYFRQAFISNQANLRPFFDLLPFILLFLAPAIAMRTFAQEQRNKTLEVLFAHPITELDIIIGKFIGSLGFYAAMLGATISLPITALLFANPDMGVVVSQYLGALFIGGAFLAIGIATSTLVASQVASFLLAASVNFVLILIGFDIVLLSLPSTIGAFVSQLAILPHASNISRGALDMRDLLYFVTLIGVALTVAVIKLSARKISENQAARQKLYIALGLIVGLGVIANVFMYSYPLRLDLTANKLFTLSKGTRTTLTNLPDVLTMTLYTSNNLPGTVEATVRQTKDILRDYHRLGKGKIKLVEKHPDINQADKTTALNEGIQEVQFNTLSNNAFAVQAGYVGLSLQYLDKKESIPFVQNAGELEYQLTRLIRKMTTKDLPILTLFTQPDISASGQSASINTLRSVLRDQYDVRDLDLSKPEASISGKAVVVYGLNTSMGATASAKLKSFISEGGNALLLFDNHTVNPQLGTAPSYSLGIEDILAANYGITVNQDLVYDLRLNEIITLQSGNQQYLMPYPFWLKAIPAKTKQLPIESIGSVSLAWPNSFAISPKEGVTQEILLTTSKNGGAQQGSFQIAPDRMKPEEFRADGQEKPLAVYAYNTTTKLIAVGDSDFITDQFVQNAPQNLNFANLLIDTVATDDVMATVTQKTGDNPVFTFDTVSQAQMVQYLNLFGVPVAVGVFGGWWLWKRKKLYRRIYK
jgi:ABC-2 type transport system permease protein